MKKNLSVYISFSPRWLVQLIWKCSCAIRIAIGRDWRRPLSHSPTAHKVGLNSWQSGAIRVFAHDSTGRRRSKSTLFIKHFYIKMGTGSGKMKQRASSVSVYGSSHVHLKLWASFLHHSPFKRTRNKTFMYTCCLENLHNIKAHFAY